MKIRKLHDITNSDNISNAARNIIYMERARLNKLEKQKLMEIRNKRNDVDKNPELISNIFNEYFINVAKASNLLGVGWLNINQI